MVAVVPPPRLQDSMQLDTRKPRRMPNSDQDKTAFSLLPGLPYRGASAAKANGRLAPLRVPLAVKLVGANLLVVASLVGLWMAIGGALNGVAVLALALAVLMHLALVFVALRPIRDLETVASRVWHGESGKSVV